MDGSVPPACRPALHPAIQEVLLDGAALGRRVREMGQRVAADYAGRTPHLVGVLKGAVPFAADLLRAIPLPDVTVDFLGIASYGRSTETSGVVRFTKDLDEPIAGRHVLIVEDIVDTGLTLAYLREHLAARGPASLAVAAMLDKPARRKTQVRVEYVGFSIPDRFAVGYGLDCGGHFRHLPYVAALRPEAAAALSAGPQGPEAVRPRPASSPIPAHPAP